MIVGENGLLLNFKNEVLNEIKNITILLINHILMVLKILYYKQVLNANQIELSNQ